jgi:electron transfer flavoprotein alpha subunit
MAVLVVADHDNTHLRDTTTKTITAARMLSPNVDVLVLGANCRAAAEESATVEGVRAVLLADREDLDKVIAETVADLILSVMDRYDAVLAPASSAGKNFTPRVAARLDVAPITDVLAVEGPDTFTRPIYAGNALQTVQSSDAKKVITVRPTAFKAAAIGGGSAAIEEVQVPARPHGRSSCARRSSRASGPSWAPPRSSSPAVARWVRRRSSTACWSRWPTSWARPWGPAGPRSTRAMPPTITRWARRARWSRPTSTSPSASPAPSSTWPG